MTQTILHVVTNVDSYDGDQSHPTGLWLTELTHAWEIFERQGYRQLIVSPKGGKVPLEPRAMKFPLLDSYAKRWIANPENQQLLENTLSPQDIEAYSKVPPAAKNTNPRTTANTRPYNPNGRLNPV